MADWFTDLVAEACAEVVASDDVLRKLAVANPDRVTAPSVMADIGRSPQTLDQLREQFTVPLGEVEQLDASKELVLRELLPAESRTVAQARTVITAMSQPQPPAQAQRWLGALRRPRDRPDPVAARTALSEALRAFDVAADAERVRQHPAIRKIDGLRAKAVADLRGQIVAALTLRVNAIIDAALAASYEREFSYVGSARLSDQLDLAGDQVGAVNAAAIRTIQDMIDNDFTGAVGVAGPRGIGKTTLLRRFARQSMTLSDRAAFNPQQRWGVCVAAPAQYDARDFLLHLFGQLCASVLGEREVGRLEDEMTGNKAGSGRHDYSFGWFASYFGVTALLCGGVVVVLETVRPVGSGRSMIDLLIAGCCAAVAVMTVLVPGVLQVASLLLWSGLSSFRVFGILDLGSALLASFRRGLLIWGFILVVSSGTAAALFALVGVGSPPDPRYVAATGLAVVVSTLYIVLWQDVWGENSPPERRMLPAQRQFSAAAEWYRKVKFQQSFTTGWSGTVTLAPSALPVQAQAGWSGSRAVTPLAMSIPEIVTAFRSFTDVLRGDLPLPDMTGEASSIWTESAKRRIGGSTISAPTPVVIGIDEVDKIENPQAAQAFFNQIKGLFGDTKCLFLISISDDAMAAYERRGLPLRDAFDSSLSTVVTLSYLTRQEARTLIGSRLVRVTEPSADLLFVLSGGLPRELVRLIRRAVDLQRAYSNGSAADAEGTADQEAVGSDQEGEEYKVAAVPLDALAAALIADQVAAQRRAVLIRGRILEPCQARAPLLAWAGDPAAEALTVEWSNLDASSAKDYFAGLAAKGAGLIGACDGTVPDPQAGAGKTRWHADGCAAKETGAFLFWLAIVGQVLGQCADRVDFEEAEQPGTKRSFERLARARQNFPIGPHYVYSAVTAIRTAWGLTPPQESLDSDGAGEGDRDEGEQGAPG